MVAYGRDGRLYVGMGDGGSGGDPRESGAEPRLAAREDPPPRPGPPGGEAGDRRRRRQEPVALLVRPQERRPLDRRRRPELDRGGRSRRVAVARAPQLRLERLRGQLDLRGGAARPGTARKPVAQYSHDHGCSITGGYVYRGTAVPAAAGRYFYGDYCSGTVWSLKLVGGTARGLRPGAVHRQEPHLVRPGLRR